MHDKLHIRFGTVLQERFTVGWVPIPGSFIRASRRDKYGDRNDSLIPQDIMDWYCVDKLSSNSDASAELNIETNEE